jgi:hypothetical protein
MTEIPISKPEITYGLSCNIFEWHDIALSVKVDRITDDGKSELYFYHNNVNGKRLLHMGHANLLSSTMQRDFTKALSTRGLDIDWQTVLTYISRDTIAHLREGEPVVWLNDEYGKSPPEYLLPPLFVKGASNIIYADRSSAKTLFVTTIDLALSLPWYDNPIGLNITSADQHKILYLDWEGNPQMMGWQKECIRRGMGIHICDIPYLHCSRSLADDISHIQKKIEEVNADVVIIDSLGMAVGDDLNLTKPAFAFYAALRQLPVTPIIVAHTSKDVNNKRKTVYGNAYYENEARSVWEVSKEQAYGSNELTITLHHRKSPPFSGYHEPLAWKFLFDEDKIMVETTIPQQDKRTVDEAPSENDAALDILMDSDEPLRPKDIVRLSNKRIKPTNISMVLKRLLKNPEFNIQKTTDGRYYYTNITP